MNEPAILGNSQHDSDVLCYRANVSYYTGNITIDPAGSEVQLEIDPDGNNHNATYEFVNEA